MTTALEVIERGLRLINVPGRGGSLSPDDTQAALESLQDIINADAVSEQFVPGVRRHFFPLAADTDIYSYGAGQTFDTDDFDDPVPVRVEDAYIREGATITTNEQVTNGKFTTATDWTLGANWTIANGKMTIATGGVGVASQALTLSAGTTYNVTLKVTQRANGVAMRVLQDATPLVSQTLNSTGEFSFSFTVSGGSTWTIDFTANALSDLDIDDVSVLEVGKEKLELGRGSDYTLVIVDQLAYNRRFTKGTGGRPYELFYQRNFPFAELRFDNSAIPGDILVMDVLVNRVSVTKSTDDIRLHPDGVKYLKYRLAYEMAGEYGKSLSAHQIRIMGEAWDALASGNDRTTQLRVDQALQGRPTFDVNRGDP